MTVNHFFTLFVSLFLLSCFLSFFVPYVLPRRSDGRGQDTSSREMSESSVGNGHPDLKKEVSLVGAFLCITEGVSCWTRINQGECVGTLCLARFGSNSVFPVCDTDSLRDTRKSRLFIISLCSLSFHFCSLNVYSRRAT